LQCFAEKKGKVEVKISNDFSFGTLRGKKGSKLKKNNEIN
jgi:hypothetical protein